MAYSVIKHVRGMSVCSLVKVTNLCDKDNGNDENVLDGVIVVGGVSN